MMNGVLLSIAPNDPSVMLRPLEEKVLPLA